MAARAANERRLGRLFCWLCAATLLSAAGARAAPPAAAIASSHPAATAAGFEVLERGGNAFDAAVAVAAALGVVDPANTGLGGGGFWLLQRADGFQTVVDGRERAPLAATRDMYLDGRGEVIARASLDGPLAAAIPGTPAALAYIAKTYGRLTLEEDLAPAIRLARDGFPLEEYYRLMITRRLPAMSGTAAAEIFLDFGEVPPAGHRIRQPDLARTLERLGAKGHDGFYRGSIAARLVEGVRAAGGIWSERDLAEYRVVERAPVSGTYRGLRVTSVPPPSSGGVGLLQMLGVLAGFDLDSLEPVKRDRLVIEAMRRAYRDRALYLGDPDHVKVDLDRLLSPKYIARLRNERITPGPRPAREPREKAPKKSKRDTEGGNTTHFSVLDREGNVVAATLSLNLHFGSGFMPAGTGVLLNDEMDDFALKPGAPNVYGLTGSEANSIAPGKRPLSSMTPTILDDGERLIVLGTPGGSRIISMVLLATLEAAQRRGELPEWLARRRFHHQYLPNEVQFEPGAFSEEQRNQLARMGYELRPVEDGYGNMQAILWDRKKNTVEAASDPRGHGGARVR